MELLVLSHTHHLLPAAWRLHREGKSVSYVPWRRRAERCWAGALPSPLPAGHPRHKAREAMGPLLERVAAGEVGVVWEHASWGNVVREAPVQWGTLPVDGTLGPLRVGAWWDGQAYQAPHLLIGSMGAWPGGGGPQVEAGMVLVRLGAPIVPMPVPPDGHRGLVQMGLNQALEPTGVGLGWHGLHTHAFLAALGEGGQLGKLLEGEAPVLPHRFACVVPVSVPPWPIDCNTLPQQHQVQGLSVEEMGRVMWHDVATDEGAAVLRVAGVDGLIGVTRGVGDSMLLARIRAIGLANKMLVPEKQMRPDVGQEVDGVLASLEEMGVRL